MNKKICVLGAGGIGSCVSASMTDAGCDITLVDQWADHINKIKSDGLRVITKEEDKTRKVNAFHLSDLATFEPKFDYIFMAVKSYDTQWMAKYASVFLRDTGTLIGLQNAFNDDLNAEMIGRDRIIGSVVELSCEAFIPGIVQRNTVPTGTWFAVGELDGSKTERLLEIQSLMKLVGNCDITDNIYGAKWTKLIANSMTCPFSSLNLKNWEAIKLPGMFDFSVGVGKESFKVGQALGHMIEPLFGLTTDEIGNAGEGAAELVMKRMVNDVGPNARTHAAQDHAKDRRSEIEFINGRVSEEGKKLGIPTPYNDAVVEIAKMTHSGEIKLDPSNLELLLNKIK
jgi:2-dehydropantoate 2-reductase